MTVGVQSDLASLQGSEKLSAPAHSIVHSITHSAGDGSGAILVPDARLLFGGEYKQSGVDLILSKDGRDFTVHDYFKGSHHADLRSPDGATLSADIVDALSAHVQYAQASGAADAGKVIGQVTKLTGSSTAIRNGVAVELHVGDNVMKGDVVQAGAGSALVMTFIDGTVFGLASNARMVLNEMIYDPNGSSNSSLLSLVQGTVSFVAGETAKHGDMRVDTPVATMGIRGTAGMVDMPIAQIGFDVTQSNAPPIRFEILLEPGKVVGSYLLLSKTDPNVIYGAVDRNGIATYLDGNGNLTRSSSPPLSDAAKQIIIDTLSTYFPSYIPDLNNANPQSGPGSHGSPPIGQPTDGLFPIPQFLPLDQLIQLPVPISVPPSTNAPDQPPIIVTAFVPSSSPPVVTAASFSVSGGKATVLAPSTFLATDPKQDTDFTFVLSNVTHGTFQVTSDGIHWTDTTSVTTQQLNLGEVRFVPDGTGLPPTFSIQALNGDATDNASAVVAGNVLLLTVSNPTVSVVTGPSVNVTQGETVLLNVLAVESNQNVPSVMISGAPSGAVLSDGHGHTATSDGSTPINVAGWTLSSLSITPTSDVNFTLTVTATDGNISASATEQVNVDPTAPTVTWAAATPVSEGTAIALGTLAATITSEAGDTNTLNALTIGGAPAGAVLSDGHGHSATSDGSTPISVVGWNLSTLTITPTSDTNFTLTATATEKDADGDISTAATATELVTVKPTAPTVTWAAATPGDEGKAIALGNLAATVTSHAGDTNTLNTLTIGGAPSGAVLSDGHGHSVISDGSTPIDVAGWNLSTLAITPSSDGNFTLTATATERDADGDISTTATATEQVTVGPTAPTVTWAAATPGVEGTPIALGALAATITGQDGDSNTLDTLTISGAPSGAVLSDGHGHSVTSDGSTPIDVAGWNLSTLAITPSSDANFTLTATATERDADGDISTTATATEQVTVGPTAPTVTWAAATPGVEGTPIALGALAATITGQDGDSNTLDTLTISGAPSGAVLSDGHGHSVISDGSTPIDVAGWNLSTLAITPSSDANFTLTATATERDADGDISTTATATEQVTVGPTAPTVTWAAATPGVEGTAIALGTLAATITGQAGDSNSSTR